MIASLSIAEEERMLRKLFLGRRGVCLLVGWRRDVAPGVFEAAAFDAEFAMDALADMNGGARPSFATH